MEASRPVSEDRDRLVEFLDEVRSLLKRLLGEEDLFRPGLTRALWLAFDDLERQRHFANAQDRLGSGELDGPLIDHGLTGAQLDLKLTLFESAQRELDTTGRRGRRRAWGWLLRVTNVLLTSLANVIPPLGAVKEFKDATEAALDPRGTFRKRLFGRRR